MRLIRMRFLPVLVVSLLALAPGEFAGAADEKAPDFTRQQDVVYGRKYGMALTMDVFTPKAERQRRGRSSGWSAAAGSRRTRRSTRRRSTSC